MIGVIERIRVFPEKSSPGIEEAEAELIHRLGLKGDFHAKGGERQISLRIVASQLMPDTASGAEKGLCTTRFKENITIRECPGVSDLFTDSRLSAGKRLAIGDALLEISGETKQCYEECKLYRAGKTCSLAATVFFAKVLKSGIIRSGDAVELC